MSRSSLAVRERSELADLLDELGPDEPTCCEGWQTAHLAAHLAVRDRRLDAMPGYEDRARARTRYAELVRRVRTGPPPWSPFALPGLGDAVNGAEYAIHHEDARR